MRVFWAFVFFGFINSIMGVCIYYLGDYTYLANKYWVAVFLAVCVIFSGFACCVGWWKAKKLLSVLSLLWGVVGLYFLPNLMLDLPLALKGQVYFSESFPEILEVVKQSDYNYSYRGRIGNVEVRLDEPFQMHRWYRVEYMPHSKIIVYVNHFDPPKEGE